MPRQFGAGECTNTKGRGHVKLCPLRRRSRGARAAGKMGALCRRSRRGVAMAVRVEWRTRGEMDDTLLVVDDDDNTVRQAVKAAPTVLRDFLNDMAGLDTWREGPSVAGDERTPGARGGP